MLRILGVTAVHRLEDETIQSIISQRCSWELDWFFPIYNIQDPDTPSWGLNIVYKYEKARQIAIALNYSHLFLLESDIIAPSDALERLINLNADIALGLYRLRPEWSGGSYIFPRLEPNSGIREPNGMNFGCTLIGTHVLREIEFDIGLDGSFYQQAKAKGFKILCDTSLLLGHKDKNGKVYWIEDD